ncbi:MAG TPA: right-handed parallel beta-helix repeat-containing protein, partial [Pirellulales bacterium]|nr:right-handed parallel beta-helix repeat-containing protein [Pirellulales bacterium]
DSFAAIANYQPRNDTKFIFTGGWSGPGTQGGAVYAVATSDPGALYTAGINKAQFRGPGGPGTGKWAVLVAQSPMNVWQFGALCNGVHDDAPNVQAAILFALNFGLHVKLAGGMNIVSQVNVTVATAFNSASFADGFFVVNYTGSGYAINIILSSLLQKLSFQNVDWKGNVPAAQGLSVQWPGTANFTGYVTTGGAMGITAWGANSPPLIVYGPDGSGGANMPSTVGPGGIATLWQVGLPNPAPNNVVGFHILHQVSSSEPDGSFGRRGIYTVETGQTAGSPGSPVQLSAYNSFMQRPSTLTLINCNFYPTDPDAGSNYWKGAIYVNNAWFGRAIGCQVVGAPSALYASALNGLIMDGLSIGFETIDCIFKALATGWQAIANTGQHTYGCAATGVNFGYVSDPTQGTYPLATSPWSTWTSCHANGANTDISLNGTSQCQIVDCLLYFLNINTTAISVTNSDAAQIKNCSFAGNLGVFPPPGPKACLYVANSNDTTIADCYSQAIATLVYLENNANGNTTNCDAGNIFSFAIYYQANVTALSIANTPNPNTVTLTYGLLSGNWSPNVGDTINLWGLVDNSLTNPLELNG